MKLTVESTCTYLCIYPGHQDLTVSDPRLHDFMNTLLYYVPTVPWQNAEVFIEVGVRPGTGTILLIQPLIESGFMVNMFPFHYHTLDRVRVYRCNAKFIDIA